MRQSEYKTPVEEMFEQAESAQPNRGLELVVHIGSLLVFLALIVGAGYWQAKPGGARKLADNPVVKVQSELEWLVRKKKKSTERGHQTKTSKPAAIKVENYSDLEGLEQAQSEPVKNSGAEAQKIKAEDETEARAFASAKKLVSRAKNNKTVGTLAYLKAWKQALDQVNSDYLAPVLSKKLKTDKSGFVSLESTFNDWYAQERSNLFEAEQAYLNSLPLKSYDGWSFQKQVLSKAPDFRGFATLKKYLKVNLAGELVILETPDGFRLAYRFFDHYLVAAYQDELGREWSGGKLIEANQSFKEVAQELLDTNLKLDRISVKGYQQIKDRLNTLPDYELDETAIEWLKNFSPDWDLDLAALKLRIGEWSHFHTSENGKYVTHYFHHYGYKQSIVVDFGNELWLKAPLLPMRVGSHQVYQTINSVGDYRYVVFPRNAPTHKITFRVREPIEGKKDQYRYVKINPERHTEFISKIIERYGGSREIKADSWEFWAL